MFETGHLAECRVVTRGHIPKLQSLRISETFPNFQHISSVGSMFFLQTSFWPNLKHPKKNTMFLSMFFSPRLSGASIPVRQKYGFGRRRAHEFEALAFAADTAVPRGEAWGTQRRGAVAKEGSASDGRADFSTSDGAKVSSKSSRFPEILTSQLREMRHAEHHNCKYPRESDAF